jgi:hypothetical protein
MGNLMGNQLFSPSVGQSGFPFSHLPRRGSGKSKGKPRGFPFPVDFPGCREVGKGKRETADRLVCTRCGMEGHRASQCGRWV